MSATISEVLAGADLSDAELIALTEELADAPREPWSRRTSGPALINTPWAQAVTTGMENPLWEIVQRMPTEPRWYNENGPGDPNGHWALFLSEHARSRAAAAGLERTDLCVRYSWSIPSPGDIAWIREQLHGQDVVEIGAGGGYWAWQLTQAGIAVAAYDPYEPGSDNNFARHRLYHPVMTGDHTMAANHPDRALMLCWPSYCDPFAKQALHAYEGDTVIYIGEGEGGCCADDRFHRILRRDFEEIGESPDHVTYWGIHCSLTMWRRRGPKAIAPAVDGAS